ncbi:LLM class flavin-dependent oxidoreductase [Rhodococcus qingshengii]|uniref:LLM class flavin-dependent oxidoreductase n=1 Tax=Rhodococcus qingshengii TaxID=334542 RepID=UPI00352E3894
MQSQRERRNLRIGGILAAHFYDVIRLAEDVATVDLLSEGRLVLGLGHGWRDSEFDAFGVDKRGLGLRLEHIIDDLRNAWSEDGSIRGVSVTPKPYSSAGDLRSAICLYFEYTHRTPSSICIHPSAPSQGKMESIAPNSKPSAFADCARR